jgi:16S rRNA (cytosine1402-N4)-methyltransferase
MPYLHIPVLLEEVIDNLKLKPGDKVVDCTLGGAGHAEAILKKVGSSGKYIGIDLDKLAIESAKARLKEYKDQIILVNDNFNNLEKISNAYKFNEVNAFLFDLGLSSGQLQDQSRGFSFLAQGSLDMRFGSQSDLTAEKILNSYSQSELVDIFKNYGEERLALPISKMIIAARKKEPFNSPKQLVGVATDIYKKYYRGRSKINPATKIFQALRIATNKELENIKNVLPQANSLLVKGGRLAVISYHSLEDKIVKDFFRQETRDCICPLETPVCQCSHEKTLKIITKKPILPTNEEIIKNHRARSAKLRVAEKI